MDLHGQSDPARQNQGRYPAGYGGGTTPANGPDLTKSPVPPQHWPAPQHGPAPQNWPAPQSGPGTGSPGGAPGDGVLVDIGPSGKAYGRGVAARLAILAPLILVNLYNASNSSVSPGMWWAIIGVAAVIAVGAVLRMIKRVQLTATSVVVTRVLGGPRSIPRQQLAYGILVQYYQQFGNAAGPLLILVDGNRKKLLYLSGQLFAGADMYTLARGIGLQNFDVITEPTTPKLLAQRHPGVLSFMERRPWAFAWIVVAVIIVVVIVALVAAGV
ncbi:hypothetical protein [Nakamurella lactea]|uniref:hypothetical protein n=1 Tax=Nakamurella lactea TaxID=459515 RepID=UPI0004264BB8|nr:hypothetical protein [Nakamurella lactea]